MNHARMSGGGMAQPRFAHWLNRLRRWRFGALAIVFSTAAIGWLILPASAQDSPTDPGVQVTDAHIEGSGPWTSWIGGAPDRTLVVTILNTGNEQVDDAVLTIALGKGPDPSDPVEAPELGPIDPGERAVIEVPLTLPRFAFGTYRVEGTVSTSSGIDQFQAETSHVPWMVFLLPLLILVQLTMLKGRNAVRDRIHRAPSTSDPTLPARVPTPAPPDPDVIDLTHEPAPAVADLETVISEELDVVFDEAFRRNDEELDEAQLTKLVVELAGTAAGRVTDRVDVSADERVELHGTMTEALLAAFDLTPPSPV